MQAQLAEQLIRQGQKLAFVRHAGKSAFYVRLPFEMAKVGERWMPIAGSLTEACGIIPSWQWQKDMLAYRIHYLDLKILETLAYTHGYTLEYEDVSVNFRLRSEYLDRRTWKTKAMIEIPLKRPLDEKQTVGAQFLYRSCWAMNADGMGAGKTAQAIGAIILNKLDGRPYRTLIVAPKTAKGGWAKEVRICTDLSVLVLSGNIEKRFDQYDKYAGQEVVICSFDTFISDYKELAKIINPNILVIDEVHRICEKGNNITQVLIGGKKIKKTFLDMCNPHSGYLLTGTPISNNLEDLYALLRLMDRDVINWSGFRNRYCVTEEGSRWEHPSSEEIAAALANQTEKPKSSKRKFLTIVGYKNGKELKAKLDLYMIRRTKDEMLPDLPPKTFTTVEVEFDAEERAIYDQLEEDFQTEIRGKKLTVTSKLTWMTKAQQIADSLELVKGSGAKKSSKLAMLMQIVKAEAPKRKIVIFSKYKEMTDIIVRELKALRMPCMYLHGDIDDDDRQPMIDEFQGDETIRVFVSTLKAGGVAITLTSANLCILYDSWWSPGANFQAADRLHRRGQPLPVEVMFMRVKGSVETYVAKTWVSKQGTINDTIRDEDAVAMYSDSEMQVLI